MMHQPLAGLRGQATDIAIQAEQLAYTKRRMAELTPHHSGQTLEQIQKDSERDRWFTADQAKAYGLVDSVKIKRGETARTDRCHRASGASAAVSATGGIVVVGMTDASTPHDLRRVVG